MTTPTDISSTLAERGSRYGEFIGHACITQAIKLVMQKQKVWNRLGDDQREALEMIAHKIGRIINDGADPDHHDSWHDIVGYAKLVADRLAPKQVQEQSEIQPTEKKYTYHVVLALDSLPGKHWILERDPMDLPLNPEPLAHLFPSGTYAKGVRDTEESVLSDTRMSIQTACEDVRDSIWRTNMAVLLSEGYLRHFREFHMTPTGQNITIVGHRSHPAETQPLVHVQKHPESPFSAEQVAHRILDGLREGMACKAEVPPPAEGEEQPGPGSSSDLYSLEDVPTVGHIRKREWKLYQGRTRDNHGAFLCVITGDQSTVDIRYRNFPDILVQLLNGTLSPIVNRSLWESVLQYEWWRPLDGKSEWAFCVTVKPEFTLPAAVHALAIFSGFNANGEALRAKILNLFYKLRGSQS